MNVFGTEVDLNNIMDLKLKNQANTNVLNWGGKLLAYFEAGLPHRWVGAATVINDWSIRSTVIIQLYVARAIRCLH